MNLWVLGEGGHPAWYCGVENWRLDVAARIGHGWTPRLVMLTQVRVLVRAGLIVTLDDAEMPDHPCACGACQFLTLAASNIFCANRQPDEDWRKAGEIHPWWSRGEEVTMPRGRESRPVDGVVEP